MLKSFDESHYVPLLKSKQAELKSLYDLKSETKDRITPLIEVTPQDYDYRKEEVRKTIDQHLTDVIKNIAESWETRPFFIDFQRSVFAEVESGPAVPFIASLLQAGHLTAVPVVSIPHTYLDEVCTAVKPMPQISEFGVCLRILPPAFDSETLEEDIETALSILELTPSQVDLILDCEDIGENVAILALALKAVINGLPHLNEWRSLTVAASAFPKDTAEIAQATKGHLTRYDWILWKQLNTPGRRPKRVPSFGDYTISHPELFEGDASRINVPVHVRYTLDEEWMVHKWGSVRKGGASNFPKICEELVSSSDFHGESFSWGDNHIKECAEGAASTGNPMTWRRIGISHHMEKVVTQIPTP